MALFPPQATHRVALAAFDEMDATVQGGNVSEYNERQYVFELGFKLKSGALTSGRPLCPAFEQNYPVGDGGTLDRTRVDILVWWRRTHTYGWIEVKSTGLDHRGSWNNAFSKLGWKHDFEKLRGVNDGAWAAASHEKLWVWVYLFETYRTEVEAGFGSVSAWSEPMTPGKMATAFGTASQSRVTLPTVLLNIEAEAPDSLASIKPLVQPVGPAVAALVLTSTL